MDVKSIYKNYSVLVLYVNAYNCKVIVTLKNRIYQVTVLTTLFHLNFEVTIILELCFAKDIS